MRMFSAPQLNPASMPGAGAWPNSQSRGPWPGAWAGPQPQPEAPPAAADGWGAMSRNPFLAGFGVSPMLSSRGLSPPARAHAGGGVAAEGPVVAPAHHSPRRLPTPLSARMPTQAPPHLDATLLRGGATPLGTAGPSTARLAPGGPSADALPQFSARDVEEFRLRRRSASSRPSLHPQPQPLRTRSPMIEVRQTPQRTYRSLTPPKLRAASPVHVSPRSSRPQRTASPAPPAGPQLPVPHLVASPPLHAQVQLRPMKAYDHSHGELREVLQPTRTPRRSLEPLAGPAQLRHASPTNPSAPSSQAELGIHSGHSPPIPSSPAEELQDELAEGAKVQIGEAICRVTAPLGMGSFGVVWAAECSSIEGDVAVKEILCQSQTDLARAVYEAQLLWMLGATATPSSAHRSSSSMLRGSASPLRIPAYVASDMAQTGEPEVCRVRLAMTRIPGEPLDRYLRDRRHQLDVELSELSDDALPEALQGQVAEAHSYARELILQLAPTMEKIATLAYHRDVNAHNILLSVDNQIPGATPQYGLVDFGLAVDATRWRGGEKADAKGTGDWQHLDVGGDCRYWPASAWLQFQVGCYDLATAVSLCLEYQTHLDLQGLGITAMQVLIEMMPTSANGKSFDSVEGLGKLVPPEFWQLGIVWDEYWDAATRFWTALLDTFRNNGDWNVLKNEFIQIGVHDVLGRKLAALRKVLTEVEEACKRLPSDHYLHEAEALFASLLVLISSGEEREGTTMWEEVLAPFKQRGKSGSQSTMHGSFGVQSTTLPSTSSLELPSTTPPSTSVATTTTVPAAAATSPVQAESVPGAATDQSSYWLPPPTQIPKGPPAVVTHPAAGSPSHSPTRQLRRSPPQVSRATLRGGSPPPGSPQQQVRVHSPQRSPTSAVRLVGTTQVRVASPTGRVSMVDSKGSLSPSMRHRADAAAPKDAHYTSPVHQLRALSPSAGAGSPRVMPRMPSAGLLSPRAEAPLTPDFVPGGESRDLFLRLSNLASKVVQLANAMETLELRDRDLAAAAARRINGGVEVTGVGLNRLNYRAAANSPPSVAAS
mmetsp:Transcript_25049/g.45969  ORF Transcript_25049/g.45969 Transcript_25049/m.45969 type:complete len:1050 (-) Transcript_25049:47-3196(-)